MRNISKSLLATATILIMGSAHAVTYVAVDDSVESRLCVSAATDKNDRFMINLEQTGIRLSTAAKHLECNGEELASWVANAGNKGVYQRVLRFAPEKGSVEIREVSDTRLLRKDAVIYVKGE